MFFEVVAHQGYRGFVGGFGGQGEEFAFFADEVAVGVEDVTEGFFCAAYAGDFRDAGRPEVFAEAVFGLAAEHEDAFGQFVYFFSGVVVEFFEFAVQDEEAVAFDVPVEAAQVGVVYLVVGQKGVEGGYYVVYFVGIEVEVIYCFHMSFFVFNEG